MAKQENEQSKNKLVNRFMEIKGPSTVSVPRIYNMIMPSFVSLSIASTSTLLTKIGITLKEGQTC